MLKCRVLQGVDLSSNSRGDRVMLKRWFSWQEDMLQGDVSTLKVNAQLETDAS